MSSLTHWILLGAAGAAGTLARAAVTNLAVRIAGTGFPWGTLAVNVLGSLCFGAIVGATRSRLTLPAGGEVVLLVGLLGGFTTFSSHAFQVVELFESGRVGSAAAYALGANLLGFLAVWAGLRLAG